MAESKRWIGLGSVTGGGISESRISVCKAQIDEGGNRVLAPVLRYYRVEALPSGDWSALGNGELVDLWLEMGTRLKANGELAANVERLNFRLAGSAAISGAFTPQKWEWYGELVVPMLAIELDSQTFAGGTQTLEWLVVIDYELRAVNVREYARDLSLWGHNLDDTFARLKRVPASSSQWQLSEVSED